MFYAFKIQTQSAGTTSICANILCQALGVIFSATFCCGMQMRNFQKKLNASKVEVGPAL